MFETELELRREDYPETVLDEIRADPESETYQFVMKAALDDGSQGVVDMAHRVDELSDRILDLQVSNRLLLDQLAVHPADGETRHELYLMCDDIRATLADLRARGVEVAREVSDQGWGLLAAIRLPDGSEFPIYEPRHPLPPRA